MIPDFRTFLAANVLNDRSITSYRSLSREIKVHNNVAKQMLYDFYHHQTSKEPGSVHATYLVSGILNPAHVLRKGNNQQEDGEDAHMQSSPFVSSQVQPEEDTEMPPPVKLITLVREEDLEVMVHYLTSAKNLQTLSDCNRAISKEFAPEDPLIYGKLYGVIQNSQVKRRSGRRPVLSSAPENTVKVEKPAFNSQETGKSSLKNVEASAGESPAPSKPGGEAQPRSDAKIEEPRSSDKKIMTKPPTMKREQSDIFKSFSKPKAKVNREDTRSSTGASPAAGAALVLKQDDSFVQEDGKYLVLLELFILITCIEPMGDLSEDEQEDDFISKPTKNVDPKKSKAERTEQLRKMMEDEDEEMETALEDPTPGSQDSIVPNAPLSQTEPSPEPPVVVTGDRRRGRRKVMKKKTIKDEEGYLVTKEEPAWESFSEDEPPSQKDKTPASTASSMAKGKKSGSKVGQGNIMNFFGRK